MEYKDIVKKVQRPSRYLGNEINSIHKSSLISPFKKDGHGDIRTKIALIFPDLYEIGMSHLGLKILYHIINLRDDAVAERVFAPDTDYEDILIKNNLPLASLESSIPLRQFDMLGFTIQYELSYTNILNILKLGAVPLKQSDRKDDMPLVIGGGPCAFNPEPIADFFDLFVVGDGEEVINELIDRYKILKRERLNRKQVLNNLAEIDGVYIPSLFSVSYKNDWSIDKILSLKEGYNSIKKRTVYNLNSSQYPTSQIVPYTQLVHDRVSVEIDRGCTHGCRFCQAGIIYRPLRERAPEKVIDLLSETLKNTGYEDVSLSSLSSGDYCNITSLIKSIMDRYGQYKTSISLPSLRPDTLNPELLREVSRVRKTGFTIAIEAGTQRMRNIINKKIKDEDIYSAVNSIVSAGWDSLKLYFMIGLPSETNDDIEEIYNLCLQILKRETKIKNINVSISSFVPKAHTPFQWVGQEDINRLKEKLKFLHRKLKTHKKITIKWHKIEMSLLEGVFARGDRRLGLVLERAVEMGCKFDGWTESFDFKKWMDAFDRCGINPYLYANRNIKKEENLPWDHIKTGISRKFLNREFEMSLDNQLSSDCRYEGCIGCGLNPANCLIISECEMRNVEPKSAIQNLNSEIRIPKSKIYNRIRMRYEKRGDMKLLSHLEVGKVFTRAFKRAGIPLFYSEGYHPHPKIAFGFALPVGMESGWEYLDIEIKGHVNNINELSSKLNIELPAGLKIISAEAIQPGSKSIFDIIDRVFFSVIINPNKFRRVDIEESFKNFFLKEKLIVERIRKGSIRKIDIKPLVDSIKVSENENYMLKIEMGLKVLNGTLLQPIEVLRNILSLDVETAVLSTEKTGIERRGETYVI